MFLVEEMQAEEAEEEQAGNDVQSLGVEESAGQTDCQGGEHAEIDRLAAVAARCCGRPALVAGVEGGFSPGRNLASRALISRMVVRAW